MRVAVIPARGGSKRIPRKNIRLFRGKPMIGWSIEAARQSALFDRVIVSTDDDEIAHIAREFGAECPFVRPAELAGDHVGADDVVSHALRWLLDQGASPDAVCCIFAAAPFIRAEDLASGWTALVSGDWDYAFAAAEFPSSIYRAFTRHPEGGLEMVFPQHYLTRSQDLPVAYHDAGQFYWGRPAAWMAQKSAFGRRSVAVMIPHWRVQDIDTPDDWRRAELLASALESDGVMERQI